MYLALTLTACLATPLAPADVPRWGRWEAILQAGTPTDWTTELTVELTAPSGKKHAAAGFWDGGSTWKVRFRPDEAGAWKWQARSRPVVPGLDGTTGGFTCVVTTGKTPLLRHGPVRVARAGTHLERHDGTPFFWLGDTVWTGPALSTAKDWASYLDDRAARRFSVIQYNAISPWRTAPTDGAGRVSFTGRKEIQVVPAFFQQLDERIDAINARGLVAAHVLAWALKPADAGSFLPEADLIRLIRYQVARYGAHDVVWILAGDNPYNKTTGERWKRIGRAVFGGGSTAPVTTHPTGMNWPWESWRDEKWLTLLGYQSGHGDDARTLAWIHSGPVRQTKRWTPPRPIINLEPPYEDHRAYQSRQPHPAYNVRRAVYWSLLNAPTAGVTYGGHGIWSWQTVEGKEPRDHAGSGVARTWRQALQLPGGAQMTHLVDLFTSLRWWQLRPAESLLVRQPGGSDPAKFVAVAATPEVAQAILYLPVGGRVELKIRPKSAEWFDPRTGQRTPARGDDGRYQAPNEGDWVLLLTGG